MSKSLLKYAKLWNIIKIQAQRHMTYHITTPTLQYKRRGECVLCVLPNAGFTPYVQNVVPFLPYKSTPM